MKKTVPSLLLMLLCNYLYAADRQALPIMVMAEDSDPGSIKRSSEIHRRVMTEIQYQFTTYNWQVIDENTVAANVGWLIKDRRPKEALVQVVELTCGRKDKSLCPRALVTFKIRAMAKDIGFDTKAQVRINGDIYDVDANQYLSSWTPMRMEFPAPRQCSGACIEKIVSDHAPDIATGLGAVLAEKLAYLQQGNTPQGIGKTIKGKFEEQDNLAKGPHSIW